MAGFFESLGNAVGVPDPTFKALLTSKQYQSADPDLRKIILEAYQKASPEDRQTFVHGDNATEGLTLAPEQSTQNLVKTVGKAAPAILKNNVVTGSKEGGATAIDMTGQVGGAVAGTALAGPIGGAVGETLGSVGADRLNRAIGLRDPNVVNLPTGPINMALGTSLPTQVPNQNILGPIKTSDLLAAAPPLVYRGVAGAMKYTTKPARAALTAADTETAAAQSKHAAFRNKSISDAQEGMGAAEDKAAQQTTTNATNLDNYKQASDQFGTAVMEHQDVLDTAPANARAQVKVSDYRKDYAASKIAASGANPVDLTAPLGTNPSFFDTAKSLGIDLRSPADAPRIQSRFPLVTDALGEWASEGPQPLQRVIDTHQRLGKLISTLRRGGGAELGAAKEMYASLDDTLQQVAKTDPISSTAVTKHLEGNAGFRKQMALDDYTDMFNVKKGYTNKPGVGKEVKSEAILNNYDDLYNNNRFYRGSFSPAEHQALEANLTGLPTSGIPTRPTLPPGAGEVVEPDYSNVKSTWAKSPGESGATPEPVKPDVGNLPLGKFILAKVGVSELGSRAMGQQGSSPGLGLASAASLFLVPHWVSKALLNNEGIVNKALSNFGVTGTDVARNIIAGKQAVDPKMLAALTAIAKNLGGAPGGAVK